MLSRLYIRNYILIDSLEVDFPEGLVIITGQTGAGKSIILGALSLLLGGKADASLLSEGADNCIVEAEFDISDPEVASILAQNDVDWDGGHLIIRRQLARSGRSRSFVNDSPVQLGILQSIAAHLVDIHSQHRSLLLTDHQFQLTLLDLFAGNSSALDTCRAEWAQLCACRAELQEARERLQRLSADQGYNQAVWEQLDKANLRSGELEELEEEQKQLANAEQIKEALCTVSRLLEGDDNSERPGMDASLKEARRRLDMAARFVPSAQELAQRLDSARLELEDILAEVQDMDSKIDLSADRLQMVEDRMSLLYSLLKKHSCSTIDELMAQRDKLSDTLYDSTALEDRILALEREEQAAAGRYAQISEALHATRCAAAPEFAQRISSQLHFLELDRAAFDVELAAAPEGPSGQDRAVFLFSSTGSNLQDVAKCASGGEMSRIMLCLKAMMARFAGMPTLIFDEIDTGVSGSVADKMGRMICDMGRDMQVISITHLPQVAAKGNAHFVVSRQTDAEGRSVSTLRELKGEERVAEIARLLSGAVVTPEAVANAKSLMDN